MTNRTTRWRGAVLSLLLIMLIAAGCGQPAKTDPAPSSPRPQAEPAPAKETIVFADGGWDSIQVHARIAAFITQHGYGYPVEFINGETVSILLGLEKGDIDVNMELWVDQLEAYKKAMASGKVVDLGPNFADSAQGWFVPTYIIKGDEKRGIKPVAPDLKSVADLPRYAAVFKDPETPNKGRLYGCVAGWVCEKVNLEKMKAYGLEETYEMFYPGSDVALTTSLVTAYEKGEPWLGYYWGPTWVFGQMDLTQLEESPFTEECWKGDKGCAYPTIPVHVGIYTGLTERAPDVVAFLKTYETSMKLTSEVLNYMYQNKAKADEGARWFLKEKEAVWTAWVPKEVADKVRGALK